MPFHTYHSKNVKITNWLNLHLILSEVEEALENQH